MTPPLSRDVAWLNARLDEVGPCESLAVVDRIRDAAQSSLDTDAAHPVLQDLAPDEIHAALKLLTIRFHLRNKAEQVHIARINRQRERAATSQAPRPESLHEAVHALRAAGATLTDLRESLAALAIAPTLTAHPTESRRRSVLAKQQRVGDMLTVLDSSDPTPTERGRAESEVRQSLALLLATDEVRSRRLDVIDEVRNGLHYMAGTIWNTIPRLYQDLRHAIEACYGETIDLPIMLTYRTWIGGDRDGNPNVTAALTQRTLEEMHRTARERHAETLEQLHRDLSLSGRRVPIAPALLESIERDAAERPLDPHLVRHLGHEPFRVKIHHMQARLHDPAYTADRLVADLRLLRDAVDHAGLHEVAHRGLLDDALLRARTFGFHLASLDIRQHSRVHEAAVAEMLRTAGVHGEYAGLDKADRLNVLRTELRTSRPLLRRQTPLSPTTRELLDTLTVVATAVRADPRAIGSYIVSMTHEVSDLLEVLILLREADLWRIEEGVVTCPIDVVPLFETVDDLGRSESVMRELFAEPAYAGQLAARDRFQEIMLGYSDSNKDGGYWVANWRLYGAQDALARACAEADVALRLFHGRGGTIARGGGRARRAILTSPPASANGRIRFTEQGEVISFRYAMPALAHRHLEQIVNAVIQCTTRAPAVHTTTPEFTVLMDRLAETSRTAYRALIDDPGFWPWFVDCSPVLHIGELPIASRPVSRSFGEICFDNLRAIPWVFAWTQMRYNVPGWYGLGAAFEQHVMTDEAAIDLCRTAYESDGAFGSFIDNAQQEMARARLAVARWYAGDRGRSVHEDLAAEFDRAEGAILAVTGQDALLDNNPVIQRSIRERNPDTDVINALQVELLRRWRTATVDEQPAIRSLILLSVNALAAAMQSTG